MKAHINAQALLGVALLSAAAVVAGGAAEADEAPPPAYANLSSFGAQAVAGVVDFQYQYSEIGVIPFTVKGGVLSSFSDASSSGARGVAGVLPVPLLADGQLINPTNDPITGREVPEEFREGYSKIDFRRFPNQCFSEYPDVFGDGRDEAYCGGPASNDPALGYTFGAFNGHTKSSGVEGEPLQTKSVSTSRVEDLFVPAFQATVHGAWAETQTGTNREGLSQSTSVVEMKNLSLLNGLIELSGVRAEAIALTDGTEEGSRTGTSFTVAEAYIAGYPVIISPEGVTVNKEQLPAGTSVHDANKSISEALANGDLNVRLAPAPAAEKTGSQVSIRSAGIQIINRGDRLTPANSYYQFPYVYVATNAVAETEDSAGEGTDIETGGTDLTGSDRGSDAGTEAASGSDGATSETASSTREPSASPLIDGGPFSTVPGSTIDLPTVADASPGSFSAGSRLDLGLAAGGGADTVAAPAATSPEANDPDATAGPPVALVEGSGPSQLAAQHVAALGGLPASETKDLAAVIAAVALAAVAAVFLRPVLV